MKTLKTHRGEKILGTSGYGRFQRLKRDAAAGVGCSTWSSARLTKLASNGTPSIIAAGAAGLAAAGLSIVQAAAQYLLFRKKNLATSAVATTG